MHIREIFDRLVTDAIAEAKRTALPIYTFALYHDHESHAVAAFMDTAENSARLVRSTNAFNAKYFCKALKAADLADAALWVGNVGRSLSLGDFVVRNIGRRTSAEFEADPDFYIEMARAIVAAEEEILKCSKEPDTVIFACSTADDEVGLWWGPTRGACA